MKIVPDAFPIFLFAVGAVFLTACSLSTQDISESKARELAGSAFQEYLLQKKLDQGQYKEPRVTYNTEAQVWSAYYEWKGQLEAQNSIHIMVDKFGRVELHAEKP